MTRSTDTPARRAAVIFDLDGVLTDTAELHYQSWQQTADRLGLPFHRAANEALRGLGRAESLRRLLGAHWDDFSPAQRQSLMDEKNADYLRRVDEMSPADLFPGARELLEALRSRGVRVAIASGSRNADAVVERLGIRALLDVLVDGNHAERSKPDPQVFQLAAERLGVPPSDCVVVEDAASGVAAARAAAMRVVGIGPAERVGAADLVVPSVGALRVDALLELLT
ncbi:MAG: beta-phosphoglucomutase [Phycisphaerae bacterium]